MKQKKFSLATVHIVLIVLSLIFVSPLLWMVTTAIKPIEETMTATPTLLPSKFLWDNFPKAVTYGSKELGYIPFLLYARNTLMVTLLCVAGPSAPMPWSRMPSPVSAGQAGTSSLP